MKRKSTILLLFVAFLTLVSCKKSVVLEEKVVFPNANWAFEYKAIKFNSFIKESKKPFAIILELELKGVQNVEMFYAVFTITTPKGGATMKSFAFNFVTPQEPIISTKSGVKIYKLTLYPKKYFSETGDYTFEVNQLSNKADNYGIHSLTLRIEKTKE